MITQANIALIHKSSLYTGTQ